MISSGTLVETFSHDHVVLDNHGADSRIGMGVVSGRKLKRAPQPGTIEQIH
jgi:type II secretory pathway component PulC